jgi:hypothetical protein
MTQNLGGARSPSRRNMGSLLTKTEAVTKSPPAKDKVTAFTRNLKERALQHIPPETSADNYLQIPAAYHPSPFALQCNPLRASARVAPYYYYIIELPSHIGSRIAAQRRKKSS